ncbi:unnamed protein product, partial [Mesorhabditis spiculigera]
MRNRSSYVPKLPLSPSVLEPASSPEKSTKSGRNSVGSSSQCSPVKSHRTNNTLSPDYSLPDIYANSREISMEYLADLVREKKQLDMLPAVFRNVDRLLEDEIARVRTHIFHSEFETESIKLPEPVGEVVSVVKKLYVPTDQFPEYNFVGRILGPRGMTAKQLEQETGCKIMVRGRGSMRDRRREEEYRGKPNWEHLEDELHVLVQCDDTKERAQVKLDNAIRNVRKLLTPQPEGADELKRKQLMELAILNGTFKPHKNAHALPRLSPAYPITPLRPLIMSPHSTSSPGNLALPSPGAFKSPVDYKLSPSVYDAFTFPPSPGFPGQHSGHLPPLTPVSAIPYFNAAALHNGQFFHDSHFTGNQSHRFHSALCLTAARMDFEAEQDGYGHNLRGATSDAKVVIKEESLSTSGSGESTGASYDESGHPSTPEADTSPSSSIDISPWRTSGSVDMTLLSDDLPSSNADPSPQPQATTEKNSHSAEP